MAINQTTDQKRVRVDYITLFEAYCVPKGFTIDQLDHIEYDGSVLVFVMKEV